MNLTNKDKLRLTVLLPLLIGGSYAFLWIRPTLRDAARLQRSLSTLGDTETIRARRDQLGAEQARLRRMLSEAEAQDTPSDAPPQNAEAPAASLQRLQDALRRSGVRLVSASVDAPRDAAAAGINAGLTDLMGKAGHPNPKTWNITVEASYGALLRLLDDCSTAPLPVVPLTLQMRPGPGDSNMTYWTMRVCL